jgi:hypothetical protein
MMFNSLRFRLIVSYIVIIAVCLAIMAMALALLVRSNPLGRVDAGAADSIAEQRHTTRPKRPARWDSARAGDDGPAGAL